MSSAAMETMRIAAPDGLALAGDVYGPSEGGVIVFLHGGGQSRSAWRGAARRLAHAGYRTCTMDLRGHGDSGWSEKEAYAFDDYVGDLVATIEALGGGPAVLVGASLGGHIGMLTAAQHPELAKALLLADVTPWIDETLGDAMRESLRNTVRGFATVEEAGAMVSLLRGEPPAIHGLEGLRRHLRQAEDGRFYFRWDARLMSDAKLRGGGEGGLFQREAARLVVPILVMRAGLSNLTTAQQVDAFRDVQPGLEEIVIDGIGHMVSSDVNDAYADAILAFLTARSM